VSQRIVVSQVVPLPREEVFDFFSRPENLGRITPPDMGFVLRSGDVQMRRGLRLSYRVRPFAGLPVGWVSEITEYAPASRFVDVQREGPYASWVHRHEFSDEEIGGAPATRVTDTVDYDLPFGIVGELARGLVRRRLVSLFDYRRRAVERLLPAVVRRNDSLRVVVAGGTGFVGGEIARELHRRGERVTVLSRSPERARAELPDGVSVVRADVSDDGSLRGVMDFADALVISLAFPNSPMENPRRGHTFEAVDAAGTERLVAEARRVGVRRVLYVSGAGAAPDAKRHWFRAKWRAEEAVRRSGLEYTILRPTWVYGPDDVALNRFLSFARILPFVPLTGDGRQALAPVFVSDVARLAADSLRDPAAVSGVFEVGGPQTLTMREIIRVALRVAGLRRPLLPAPAPLLKLAAWPLQLLPAPPLTPAAVDFVNQPATVDVGPLLARMPRRLTPLEEGLGTYLGAAKPEAVEVAR